jgi:hypothetical protein
MLALKDKASKILDDYFSAEFTIRPAPQDVKIRGIDRTWIHTASRYCWGVQYHVDMRKQVSDCVLPLFTNNGKQRSWVFTTHAQVLIHYIPALELAYLLYGSHLKFKFFEWKDEKVYNNGDAVTVPLKLFSDASYKQERIPWETTPSG